MTPTDDPEVVLAVVTSARGVLLIERRDGTPPLAFPGGKIEASEALAHAAAREVLEETAVEVECHDVLAVRTHPQSGTRIAYLACSTSHPTEPTPAPHEALAARWWPITEALPQLSHALHPAVECHLEERS